MKQALIFIIAIAIICVCLCFVSIEHSAPAETVTENTLSENIVDEEAPGRDNPYSFSIFYNGTMYKGMGFVTPIPEEAILIGTVTEITENPKKELESSKGQPGDNVYTWKKDGVTWLGVEITKGALEYWNEPHAFSLKIDTDQDEIEKSEKRKSWFTVY